MNVNGPLALTDDDREAHVHFLQRGLDVSGVQVKQPCFGLLIIAPQLIGIAETKRRDWGSTGLDHISI